MLPVPTPRAKVMFAASVGVLVIGIFFQSMPAVTFGGSGLIGLSLALVWALPTARRLRRQRLEFAWWMTPTAGARGALVPGGVAEVRGYLRHPGVSPLRVSDVRALASDGLVVLTPPDAVLTIAPRARTEFGLRVSARATGRYVLHGLSLSLHTAFDLFDVPLYFPNPLAIAVLPRAVNEAHLRPARAVGVGDRTGTSPRTQRGGGVEIHELRELRPGDPFNAIAWKPSARKGRLLVKEVTSEREEKILFVLDVSAGMRGGPPAMRAIDHAIEFVAREAIAGAKRGARIGLATFDGRIVDWLPPEDGARQLQSILDVLLSTVEAFDEDRTAIDEEALVGRVVLYLRRQEGLEFALAPRGKTGPSWDVLALSRYLARARPRGRKPASVVASTPLSVLLREFCRDRALALPARQASARDRRVALEDVVGRVLRAERTPAALHFLTDLDDPTELTALARSFGHLRARGHALEVLFPAPNQETERASSVLSDVLTRIYAPIESRRKEEAMRLLGRAGIPAHALAEPSAVRSTTAHSPGRAA